MALDNAALLPNFRCRENSGTPSADPFYPSTPRTTQDTHSHSDIPSLASLMAAIQRMQQSTPQRSATVSANPPRASRHGSVLTSRPQCTHMHVTRVHGLICSVCLRLPDHGWVYQCHQDQLLPQDEPLPDLNAIPQLPENSSDLEAKARVAEHLKMNPSVIQGIRRDDYDATQIDILIKQKEKVIKTIIDQELKLRSERPHSISQPFESHDVIASLGSRPLPPSPYRARQARLVSGTTPTKDSHSNTADTQEKKPGSRRFSQVQCNYTVCQWCRSIQDRLWTNFESALKDDAPPITTSDLQNLPMMNPNIALSLGLRKPPSPVLRSFRSEQSMDITLHDTSDEISVDWTPSSTGGESDSGSEPLDSSELFPCPDPLQCPVWSRPSGCAYDGGFDDGRRAENHGYLSRLTPSNSNMQLGQFIDFIHGTPGGSSSTCSSLSLPSTPTSPMIPLLPTEDTFQEAPQNHVGKARSVCGDMSAEHRKISLRGDHDSTESFGSEVEVDGGVALTEEAVEKRVPDITNA